MIAALQWQQTFCPEAEFIVKADDDAVVYLPRLEHWIDKKFRKEVEQQQNNALFFGYMLEPQPIREKTNKW